MGVGGHFWVGGGTFGGTPPTPPKNPKKGGFWGGSKKPQKMAKNGKKCIYVRLSASSFCHFFKKSVFDKRGVGGYPPLGPPLPGGSPQRFFAKPYVDSVELDQTHTDTPSSDLVWSYSLTKRY